MHHQNNWITLPWVILSWLTSQICANSGPMWKQQADNLSFCWPACLSQFGAMLLAVTYLSKQQVEGSSVGHVPIIRCWKVRECGYKEWPVVYPWSQLWRCLTLHFCLCADVSPMPPVQQQENKSYILPLRHNRALLALISSQCVSAGPYAHICTHILCRPFFQS